MSEFGFSNKMDTSMGGYFSTQFDPSTAAATTSAVNRADTTERRKNVVSVSLSQVIHLTRKEDGLVIHRQRVNALQTIGLVLNIEQLTTKNIYTIDDQSKGSPIEVQYWKNDESAQGSSKVSPLPPIMEKTYIRVIGQSRYDDKKPFIVAFRIEPILDPNEIYTHFLEVIHDSMVMARRKNDTLSATLDRSMGYNGNAFEVSSGPRIMQGFTDIQKSVLSLISKSSQDTAGVHKRDVVSSIPGISAKLIEQAIDFLANEGHIFSTTDEDTYKATDSS